MKVIIAIDGSECSLAALESVVDRPWPQDAEFLVLSVVEPPTPGYAEWHTSYVPYLDEAQKELVKEVQELVTERVAFLRREFPHNSVEGKVIEGNIRDAIVREATDWNADFIVLGSHGRRGFQKFLLGSVAEAVVSRAPCSVEIIRTPAYRAEKLEQEKVATTSA
jgi:nucleotide-binding universal stress UspA family protein